ncbi:MAG: YceH family protein [Opitutales bacterium]
MIEEETYPTLSPEEARVLGCLMEKEATTPDTYPLTLNSLLLACNQKTNRNPVVDYNEDILAEAIEGLRHKQLVARSDGAGSRVPKFSHRVDYTLGLERSGKALLAVLLLRGPQTLGELRQRTERLFAFANIEDIETALTDIAEDSDRPLWRKLPQAPGQKEERYTHLLSGVPETPETSEQAAPVPHSGLDKASAKMDRIAELEATVEALKTDLADLRSEFAAFRKEFE